MTTYDHIAANKQKTVVLVGVCTALVLAIGWLVDNAYGSGYAFTGFAFAYSGVSALVGYYAGDKIALATSGAKQVNETDNPYLVRIVTNLCISQGMPVPKVHVIFDDAINAFATGRDPQHASIAVTTGALSKLENEELEGVLAHELSHIQNYDIRVMTIVIVLVGVISIMADMIWRGAFRGRRSSDSKGGNLAIFIIGLVLMIVAPIAAQLIKLAVSRRREYLADASGALMTRFPDGLARALEKIGRENMPMQTANSSTAHLFIANPVTGKALAAWFSTHPPIADRVAKLRAMGAPDISPVPTL